MGYKRSQKLVTVRIEDEPELEVKLRKASVRTFLRIVALQSGDAEEGLREMYEIFASALVSWNLEDENGIPVPTTMEAILDQDEDFIDALIKGWTEAQSSVAPPLPNGSTSGLHALEASLPMEALSESQAS